jgi:hypothetical protein
MTAKGTLLLVLGLTIPVLAQERYTSGEFKGFTKSPTEHVIVRLEQSINVHSVRGIIKSAGESNPLTDALLEIRGPNNSNQIRSATTDAAGQFKIPKVPEGTYTLKATKSGFQSVIGTLIVSKNADRHATIKIEMPIGI